MTPLQWYFPPDTPSYVRILFADSLFLNVTSVKRIYMNATRATKGLDTSVMDGADAPLLVERDELRFKM